jgi:UDP-N-acetylmuramate--alanine ligase
MKIHFIGIGGIGVSAFAKYHLSKGDAVSGSDLVSSEITEEILRLGAKVAIGRPKAANIPKGTEKIIFTAAAGEKHLERKAAAKKGIPSMSYPEAVGELTRTFRTITVSGAHGKSTTTALSALVLEEGYCDPTVIAGTKIPEFGNSNFRAGKGSYLLLEADEWNRSFLHYQPEIAILTNIDAEHLDTYGSIEEVERTFGEYLDRVPAGGCVIANYDEARLRRIADRSGKQVVWYSLQDPETATVRRILKISGEHNVSNALAALNLGRVLGIREAAILSALSRFSGCWRRFEFKGTRNGAFVFSDYAHHPSEIRATIKAARERFPFRRVWCVFEPHQHQRLKYLWEEFISAFDLADRVVLAPVYDVAGRETGRARKEANSEALMREIENRGKFASCLSSLDEIPSELARFARPGDVVLLMGAGNIYRVADRIGAV